MGNKYFVYEIGVYNKYVREKVRAGEEPPVGLSPAWENTSLFELNALSEEHARKIADGKWPMLQGFVIDGIFKIRRHIT
tara:strand:+ start:117 stop:353 length:237 start_codon:yes stop_codon:yes gene_type:complete